MHANPWFVRDPTGVYHYFDGGTCAGAEAAIQYALERGDFKEDRPSPLKIVT